MNSAVTQEDSLGCGVACVAFVLGITYQEAKKFFDPKRIESADTYCPDIQKALKMGGLVYDWDRYKGGEIPDYSILFIGKSDYYKEGHYVVRVANKWMNPWIDGSPVENAVSGFQKTLRPDDKLEWIVYPKGKI